MQVALPRYTSRHIRYGFWGSGGKDASVAYFVPSPKRSALSEAAAAIFCATVFSNFLPILSIQRPSSR